jgi:predicted O-methyltransferase YrrM
MPSRGIAQRVSAEFGMMTLIEVAALQQYARMLVSGETVVNIGAGHGTSGAAILEALEGLKLVTVDINEGNLENERSAVSELHASHRQILKDSIVAGLAWTEGLGMVFVDGDHTFDGCHGDLTSWAPHVRNGGFILLHDCTWPGVEAAINTFLHNNPAWARNEQVGTMSIIQRVE